MTPFALALFLFLADQPAAGEAAPAPEATAPAPEAPAAETPYPTGAPRDDYQFVAWCYGALRGYVDLHDEVMPEVTRIESTYRPPNRKLADDMKVYADTQKDARARLKDFQLALTTAEKASLRPLNAVGAKAVQQGRSIWAGGPNIDTRRKAQEWMSWVLPKKCETTAATLQERAQLMGPAFKVNAEPEAPAAAPTAEAPAPPNS
jgi:hypothetical protein